MRLVEARPAQRTVRRLRIVAVLVLCLLLPASAWAAECNIEIEPHFRGFGLNPVVEKVVITSVRPARSGAYCPARVGDEILQVNQQAVPGKRAYAVLRFWRSLRKGTPRTYRISRGEQVLSFTL